MCLTIPAKIIKINKSKALVRQGKNALHIDTTLISSVKAGDYILSQNGIGIKKISAKDARAILRAFK